MPRLQSSYKGDLYVEVKVVVPKKLKENQKEALLNYANVSGEDVTQYKGKGSWLDKIIDKTDKCIVGVKNVTNNEHFFTGHFPEEPVMPGVLQIEAMAQTGGLLVLSGLDEPERYSTYFLMIDGVKFRNKVVPGDTVIFKVEMTSELRRGIATMRGVAFVGNKIVSEAHFTAQIIKNR